MAADALEPEPFVVAVALVGALRAGFEAGVAAGGVAEAIRRALDQLERGLGDYAARPSARTDSARTKPQPQAQTKDRSP